MVLELLSVFVEVVVPVFAIVGLGYALAPRLALDGRTLSQAAWWLFVPAFTFDVISKARISGEAAVRMAAFIAVAHLAPAAVAFLAARALRRSKEVTAALVMVAVFGNVGNFGLALVEFRFGPDAIVPATIYFVATMVVSFGVCVAVASAVRGGGVPGALLSVLKTPALVVMIPAALISAGDVAVPAVVARTVGLLADAMIPIMLVVLGVQLRETRIERISGDVLLATGLRLVGGPVLGALLAIPFGLTGVERAVGIVQAGMPAAVLVSIIAVEHRIAPGFVMTAVFFSTLLSLPTLTIVMSLL
jgi:malate permease and related proteins